MNERPGALLDPATLTSLGVQQQPFDAVQEDNLFIDESLELQLQMLRHNLRYSNMLQVLCGRTGAGKTTLTIGLIQVVNQELELFLVRGERGLTSSRIFAGGYVLSRRGSSLRLRRRCRFNLGSRR